MTQNRDLGLPRTQGVIDKTTGFFTRPYEDHFDSVSNEVQRLSNAFQNVSALPPTATLADVIAFLNTITTTMKEG